MQFYFSILTILFLSSPVFSNIEWHDNYDKVCTLSQKEGKPVLLFFNGSDWAGAAMKMKHEILNSAVFQEKIEGRLICMEVDFPKHTTLLENLSEQNLKLKEGFKIQDLPVLIVLDSKGRVITQISYLPENGGQLASDLLKIIELDNELVTGLQKLQDQNANSTELKRLYLIAQELGASPAMEKLLRNGLQTENAFFALEKYRLLVERGEMKSDEAKFLRQKLMCSEDLDSDCINGQSIPFTVALIDFQELSQKNALPEIAAQPLIDYLFQFGKRDSKNIWRIEMMIAEMYVDADRWEEALQHAERALQEAPESMHEEIAHSLEYIRASQNMR